MEGTMTFKRSQVCSLSFNQLCEEREEKKVQHIVWADMHLLKTIKPIKNIAPRIYILLNLVKLDLKMNPLSASRVINTV